MKKSLNIAAMSEGREILKMQGVAAATKHLIEHGIPMGRASFMVNEWVLADRQNAKMLETALQHAA